MLSGIFIISVIQQLPPINEYKMRRIRQILLTII
ncbi:unnamed protein product, partial [Rotaria sp. Silwood1]